MDLDIKLDDDIASVQALGQGDNSSDSDGE